LQENRTCDAGKKRVLSNVEQTSKGIGHASIDFVMISDRIEHFTMEKIIFRRNCVNSFGKKQIAIGIVRASIGIVQMLISFDPIR
jgi:hypothetical protein